MQDANSTFISLVHADASLIVAVKPSGLLAVPGREVADCLWTRIRARFPDALIVHRLDMATSGLMLFARGAEMQRRLGRAFEQREVAKRYVAVVDGNLRPALGEIDLPVMADWPRRPMQKVDTAHGKPSLTRFHVRSFDPASATARVELEPVTGRAHQLRVHLLALGHPILGDTLYAPSHVQSKADRLLLHAQGLTFAHPSNGGAVSFESEPPF